MLLGESRHDEAACRSSLTRCSTTLQFSTECILEAANDHQVGQKEAQSPSGEPEPSPDNQEGVFLSSSDSLTKCQTEENILSMRSEVFARR